MEKQEKSSFKKSIAILRTLTLRCKTVGEAKAKLWDDYAHGDNDVKNVLYKMVQRDDKETIVSASLSIIKEMIDYAKENKDKSAKK